MREEILVATSPKQAKALRAQGASNVIRVSFTHTEVINSSPGRRNHRFVETHFDQEAAEMCARI